MKLLMFPARSRGFWPGPAARLLTRARCGPAFAAALGLGLATLAGCSNGGPDASSYEVSKPEHPAMTAPASGGMSPGSSLPSDHPPVGGRGDLPPDHPPIGSAGDSGAPSRPMESSGPVSIAGLVFDAPDGWVREAPANALREAQFRLPGEGAEDGLVTVSRARGSVDANIERWRGQFAGSPEAKVDRREAAGLDVTEVVIEGAYRGMGGGAAGAEDHRMHALIVQAPEGQLFFKGTGPSATMERYRESFGELVRSFRKAK